MKKTVKIALVGYGTVGKGVVKIIDSNWKEIESKIGAKLEITAICEHRAVDVKGAFITRDYNEIIGLKDIDIVVELIGGYQPAKTIIVEALKSGKHVVTANKAVLAKYWEEVITVAREHSKLVFFEAAVGGGIPVIQSLNEGLAANKIEEVQGILNGTTNYILTEMSKKNVDFAKALKSAQKAGFAEANPAFDVRGIDTAHKLAVLSSIAWSSWIKISDINTIGIEGIDIKDIKFAKDEFGYIFKLVGSARWTEGGLELAVEPMLVPENHPFEPVENEYNAILIHGDASGDVMLYGKGAGQLPAASAVVSDIIFLARQVASGTAGKFPYVTYNPDRKPKIKAYGDTEASYYLRFNVKDKPGVLSKISGILSEWGVSLAGVYQKEPPVPSKKKSVPLLMLTHKAVIADLEKALAQIDRLAIIHGKIIKYRIID